MTHQDIDFVIRTQDNPEGLTELLFSIADLYPHAQVTVVDSGAELSRGFYKKLNEQLREAGLVSRIKAFFVGQNATMNTVINEGIRRTSRRFMLLLDDTMVFTEETRIEDMEALIRMREMNIGVVSGKTGPMEAKIDQKYDVSKDETVMYGHAATITAFSLFNTDVFHTVGFKASERPFESFYATVTSKTEFKILITDVIIGNNTEKVSETKNGQSQGDSAGETTEPDVPSADAGDESGSDSVPGGETEESADNNSGGGSRRSRARSTRRK